MTDPDGGLWFIQPDDVVGIPSVDDIIEMAAESIGVRVREISGVTRTHPLTMARHKAMFAVRRIYPQMSLPAIGRAFNRHHTTVLYGIRSASKDDRANAKRLTMKQRSEQ
jgi:chromosomal replication initiation ATPase DnaA